VKARGFYVLLNNKPDWTRLLSSLEFRC